VHPPEVRSEALALVEAGLNDCEISRRLGVPRRTILDWRRPTYKRQFSEVCPRCWRRAKPMRFTPADYVELLGLYLGDGCISKGPRTFRLRISLDAKYPAIIEAVRALLDRIFLQNSVDVVCNGTTGNCVNVSAYSNHLPCLLPQHGPGLKHRRRIELEPWQSDILDAHPWPFIRACIWTDGCAFINRTGRYEYLSYDFTNRSKDIVDLLTAAFDSVGIGDYRVTLFKPKGAWKVRVNCRESVARMLEHVGVKA
jgi:hypothetical protein